MYQIEIIDDIWFEGTSEDEMQRLLEEKYHYFPDEVRKQLYWIVGFQTDDEYVACMARLDGLEVVRV